MKTGSELRHEAKERVKRYRKEMTEKGYLSTTIFLSKAHRTELKRLGDEERLSRAEAAEHIFNVYLKSNNKNITRTEQTQVETGTNGLESLEQKIKALEERDARRDKEFSEMLSKMNTIFENQSKPTIKPKQVDLFDDPEASATTPPIESPAVDVPEEVDTGKPKPEAYRMTDEHINQVIDHIREQSAMFLGEKGHRQITDELDSMGILSPNGDKWSIGTKREIKSKLTAFINEHEDSIRGPIDEMKSVEPIDIDDPLLESMPDPQDKDAHREWLNTTVLNLSNDGMDTIQIADKLNSLGIKPFKKKKWHHLGVREMLKRIEEREQEQASTLPEPKTEIKTDPTERKPISEIVIPSLKKEPEIIKRKKPKSPKVDDAPSTLPDCHGQRLTPQERRDYLTRVERMIPVTGTEKGAKTKANEKRADALNAAGIRTGRGMQWTAKSVNDNLLLIGKRPTGSPEITQDAENEPIDGLPMQSPMENPNADLSLFPDDGDDENSDADSMPERLTPEGKANPAYSDWLYHHVSKIAYGTKPKWKEIAAELNAQGIVSARGKAFTGASVSMFMKREAGKRS